jgi:putative transposase
LANKRPLEKEFLAIENDCRNLDGGIDNLKDRGLRSPKLGVDDGALSFWKAVKQIFAQTNSQRCCVDAKANILNKLAKYSPAKVKQYSHDICMA